VQVQKRAVHLLPINSAMHDLVPNQIQRIFQTSSSIFMTSYIDIVPMYSSGKFLRVTLHKNIHLCLLKLSLITKERKSNSYVKKKIGAKLVRFKDISFPNDYHHDGILLNPQTDSNRRCGLEK
jgi:hypothetical protein